MAGYIIVDVEITHPEKFDEYRAVVSPSIEAYGGRFLVRRGPGRESRGRLDTETCRRARV